jgi:putative transcriptional regulator
MRRYETGLRNRVGVAQYRTNLTDAALAARAGISRSQLNRIRNRRAVPNVATAIALARALRCRVRDLFELE